MTPDFTWLFVKMIAGLVLVIGLAVVLLKFVLPRTRIGRRSQASWARVVGRLPIAPHTHLNLVKIFGRYFVLGTSEHQVSVITEVSQAEGEKIE